MKYCFPISICNCDIYVAPTKNLPFGEALCWRVYLVECYARASRSGGCIIGIMWFIGVTIKNKPPFGGLENSLFKPPCQAAFVVIIMEDVSIMCREAYHNGHLRSRGGVFPKILKRHNACGKQDGVESVFEASQPESKK